MSLCCFFPCVKHPVHRHWKEGGSIQNKQKGHGSPGDLLEAASSIPKNNSFYSSPILEAPPLECPALFDAAVTFPGECTIHLNAGPCKQLNYVGPCVLSKSMQLIPCPLQTFVAETLVDTNFRYKGPCRYLDGKGVVPAFVHH